MKNMGFSFSPFEAFQSLGNIKRVLEANGLKPIKAEEVESSIRSWCQALVCLGGTEPKMVTPSGKVFTFPHGWEDAAVDYWLYPVA